MKVAIFLDNTLEHIPYPVEFLKNLKDHTLSGSCVLVEVPNETGAGFRAKIAKTLRGSDKSPTFPGHVNLFTPNSLRETFVSAGLEPVLSFNPIRSRDQVRYVMRQSRIPMSVELVRRALHVIPMDYLLKMAYWQRAVAVLN